MNVFIVVARSVPRTHKTKAASKSTIHTFVRLQLQHSSRKSVRIPYSTLPFTTHQSSNHQENSQRNCPAEPSICHLHSDKITSPPRSSLQVTNMHLANLHLPFPLSKEITSARPARTPIRQTFFLNMNMIRKDFGESVIPKVESGCQNFFVLGTGGSVLLPLCDFFSLISHLFFLAWEGERRKMLREFDYSFQSREHKVVQLPRGRRIGLGEKVWRDGTRVA